MHYSCNTAVTDRTLREDILWNSSSKDRICLRKLRSSAEVLRKITRSSQFSMEEHLQDNLAQPLLFCIFIMALFILFPKSLGTLWIVLWETTSWCSKILKNCWEETWVRPQTSCYSANRQHLKPSEIIRVLTEDVMETKRMKRLHKGLDNSVVDWYTDSY